MIVAAFGGKKSVWRTIMATAAGSLLASSSHGAPLSEAAASFADKYCANCHNDVDREAGLDLTTLTFTPDKPENFQQWVKIHDRLQAGEMPPKKKQQPERTELASFLQTLSSELTSYEQRTVARQGRAIGRRLNAYEYETVLRDLLSAPWLQIKGQFPEDGEAYRFNKIGEALDVSHVHMTRYMIAADYAIRQVISAKLEQTPTTTTRYYARDQRTLTSRFTSSVFNSTPDRMTYPVLGWTPQPMVRWRRAPLTVGDSDPATRELEAVGLVSSNYVTGFNYRWDGFRAPVAGRYRIRFNGYTLWLAPGGISMQHAGENDKVGVARLPNPIHGDYDRISRGHGNEPITVYTRNGVLNRRVGEFDITPEPAVYDIGEIWLLANETLVPDASRFYRSRPPNFRNPLMTPDGTPSVAFRWMEVEGPLYDDSSLAGYRLLFGDLPLRRLPPGKSGGVTISIVKKGEHRDEGRNAGARLVPMDEVQVEVVSQHPKADATRLIRDFVQRAYRRPVADADVQRFIALFDERTKAGLSFTEAIIASYTAILASPGFVFIDEKPGKLDDYALATRLSLFLWNSEPDAPLRRLAQQGSLHRPDVLREQTERMMNDPKSHRFVEAFLDYWIDMRKMEDTTPSTTLYKDYYIDDALAEAALAETQLFFEDLLHRDLPVRNVINSDFTFLNERLARHYGVPGVIGSHMRRVKLPADSVRGGLLTQASVLKVTANGTTTSPVIRGKWITERILGLDIPPPPASVVAVEPDIRGAVTIRQQLDKHRSDPSCASCHRKIDPPGFALESFDVMGGWRDRYRAVSSEQTDPPAEPGRGKNGQLYEFHFGLSVDATGELPDGRHFENIREFKRLLNDSEREVANTLAKQLAIYATGAPVRFSDRPQIEGIVARAQADGYGVRRLVHEVIQSDIFRSK